MDQLGGGRILPGLIGQHAQHMQRIRLTRIGGQYAPVALLGLGQTPCLVMRRRRDENIPHGLIDCN